MRGRTVALLMTVLGALPFVVSARAPQGSSSPAPARPRLVVILVVDQMRADYVEKYQHLWKNGLARLLREGAWFREAAYPYLDTFTCSGHTTISTGTFPRTHGMISNAWFDRREDKAVACTEDAAAPLLGYQRPAPGGDSPRRLEVPTFSDELRVQSWPRPRVASVSLKARAAITLAGHRADAVTWLSEGEKTWVTSSFYTKTPVSFVKTYTDEHPVDSELGRAWQRLLDAGAYAYSDDVQGEHPLAGWTTSFPHPLNPAGGAAGTYLAWAESPFADAYLEGLAEAAVDALDLGGRGGTDFLAVSFSSLDLVGHDFGPRSQEVQDLLARLDETVGRLLAHLDRRVGAGNYVLAFSSDHGVAPIPEQMEREGVPAGRASADNLVRSVDRTLDLVFGTGPHQTRIVGDEIYLGGADRSRLAGSRAAIDRVIAAAEEEPGIAGVLWSEDLDDRRAAGDPLARAAALGYFPGRSGDFVVVTKPYWFLVAGDPKSMGAAFGTTHGSPYAYDQRVPVILMGPSIRPGQYLQPVTPADIAPTLALLCGITLPYPDGRPLIEAVQAR